MQKNNNISLYHGDCLEVMQDFEDSFFDMILCDLPYGTTKNKWDAIIDFSLLWVQYERIAKDNAAIVLTATQPFTTKLISSNYGLFKYDLVWEKTVSSNQLNVKHQPLRNHESILVFYKKKPTYNEQKTLGTPYSIKRKANYQDNSYNKQSSSEKNNDGFRHAKSVIKVPNPRIKGGHPTAKPIALLEYLIKTYSNAGDLILDNCMGSGSTGVACKNLGRKFVGIELNKTYFDMAKKALGK